MISVYKEVKQVVHRITAVITTHCLTQTTTSSYFVCLRLLNATVYTLDSMATDAVRVHSPSYVFLRMVTIMSKAWNAPLMKKKALAMLALDGLEDNWYEFRHKRFYLRVAAKDADDPLHAWVAIELETYDADSVLWAYRQGTLHQLALGTTAALNYKLDFRPDVLWTEIEAVCREGLDPYHLLAESENQGA